jgi:glyoxylase-like metal-dependent hydrolase (beta-lactamase superfamily II)
LRAVSLHRDVLVVTSALLQLNCVVVRGGVAGDADPASTVPEGATPAGAASAGGAGAALASGETFVIDSPVLPDELDALPALLDQAQFPAPSGLLATHGDWDHLLGPLAYPEVALGCAESTAQRLGASPGEAQRDLRSFDEELMIERARPLALGTLQALPVPGRCEIGEHELELYQTSGHTRDGMAIWIGWAGVLVVGDYLSSIELPLLGTGDAVEAYLATLELLRPLAQLAEYVVPGHGPVSDGPRALAILEEDALYLGRLREHGAEAELPSGRRSRRQRALHAENVTAIG